MHSGGDAFEACAGFNVRLSTNMPLRWSLYIFLLLFSISFKNPNDMFVEDLEEAALNKDKHVL
jgi:hypothetical protein